METLTLEQFIHDRQDFDATVARTPDIFRFCSGSSWQLAAHKTLYPNRETLIFRRGTHWQAWAVGPLYEFSKVLQPLEVDWYFGSPIVGPHPGKAGRFLLDTLLEVRGEYPLIWLSGIPESGTMKALLLSQFSKYFRLFPLEGCHCQSADLRGGWKHYLSRRSGKFRRALLRKHEQAEKEGVGAQFLNALPGSTESFLKRVLELEAVSWKGESAESIFIHQRFRDFYGEIIQDLDQQGMFRAVFLQKDGQDVAYAMGGMLGSEYRGFQMAYNQQFSHLSLGHLAQWELIQNLCHSGCTHYDLGMEMDYKSRWADSTRRIINVLMMPK